SGSSGRRTSRVRRLRSSSHSPPMQATIARPRKASLRKNNEASSTAPRPRPTPMATGRFRPAREAGAGSASSSRGSACSAGRAGSSASPSGIWPVVTTSGCPASSASSCAARSAARRARREVAGAPSPGPGSGLGVSAGMGASDLEELFLLAGEQRVDDLGVLPGQAVQLGLGAGDLVLTGLTVLGDPGQLLLGAAADVAHGDPGVLPLRLGELDVVAAALLGQRGQHDPDDVAVVARVHTQ